VSDEPLKPEELPKADETPKRDTPPRVIDLNNPNLDTLEAFFPSEHPKPKETRGEDEEIRKKRLFGSIAAARQRWAHKMSGNGGEPTR
jgi:hypothetical protein